MTPQEALAMIESSEKKESKPVTKKNPVTKPVVKPVDEPVIKTDEPIEKPEKPVFDNRAEQPKGKETGLEFISRINDGNIKESDITESIYREYTRSVLSGTPFTYPFIMFDGSLVITFKEASYSLADKYSKLLRKLKDSDQSYRSKLALLTFIDNVSIKGKEYELQGLDDFPSDWFSYDTTSLEECISDTYIDSFGELNETIHRCLPLLWFAFNNLLKKLISEGLPASF